MVEEYTPNAFLGLPNGAAELATAKFVVIPAPYDGTVCYRSGTAEGPGAILDASPHMEWLDEETGTRFDRLGIATLPTIAPADEPAKQMQRVYRACRAQHEAGRFPLVLGGEHSIAAPAVRAAMEAHGPLTVVQFDAHADLRQAYTGGIYSHASVMRRISEMTDSFVQIGVRSYSADEADECPDAIARLVPARQVRADLAGTIETILARLGDRVYVTFDMDGFDPAVAPGVGTPEPGGLDWFEATAILRAIGRQARIVAADVVETAPIPGQVVTEFTAARLAAKIIAYAAE